jgi:hypothetical protein
VDMRIVDCRVDSNIHARLNTRPPAAQPYAALRQCRSRRLGADSPGDAERTAGRAAATAAEPAGVEEAGREARAADQARLRPHSNKFFLPSCR